MAPFQGQRVIASCFIISCRRSFCCSSRSRRYSRCRRNTALSFHFLHRPSLVARRRQSLIFRGGLRGTEMHFPAPVHPGGLSLQSLPPCYKPPGSLLSCPAPTNVSVHVTLHNAPVLPPGEWFARFPAAIPLAEAASERIAGLSNNAFSSA